MLAMSQARIVAAALQSVHAGLEIELVGTATSGDRTTGALSQAGGKGLFTAELAAALRAGQVQLAVHSAKDLPCRTDDAFRVVAAGERGDPRDALVRPAGGGIGDLPHGATVGTSSLRRAAQLLALRDDLRVVPVRGNVETRIAKVLADDREADATVLAMAGLDRAGLTSRYAGNICPLAAAEFVPAAGQGILAVQMLASDASVRRLVQPIVDAAVQDAFAAERKVLRELAADCHSCVGVHVVPAGGAWRALAMVARPDGADMVRIALSAPSAGDAADALLNELRRRGVTDLRKFE